MTNIVWREILITGAIINKTINIGITELENMQRIFTGSIVCRKVNYRNSWKQVEEFCSIVRDRQSLSTMQKNPSILKLLWLSSHECWWETYNIWKILECLVFTQLWSHSIKKKLEFQNNRVIQTYLQDKCKHKGIRTFQLTVCKY